MSYHKYLRYNEIFCDESVKFLANHNWVFCGETVPLRDLKHLDPFYKKKGFWSKVEGLEDRVKWTCDKCTPKPLQKFSNGTAGFF